MGHHVHRKVHLQRIQQSLEREGSKIDQKLSTILKTADGEEGIKKQEQIVNVLRVLLAKRPDISLSIF